VLGKKGTVKIAQVAMGQVIMAQVKKALEQWHKWKSR